MYRNFIEKLIYALVIFLLVFSPLPSGGVRPLAGLIIQFFAFLVFILWLLRLLIDKESATFKTRTYLPLLVFLLICLLQITPLPEFLLGVVSENNLAIWEKSKSVVSNIGLTWGKDAYTISINPHASWSKFLLILSYIAFGIVVSGSFKTRKSITILLIPIFAISLFESSYGIYQYLISAGEESASGTYFNRNHFAGFLEMTFFLLLGYVLSLSDIYENKQISFFKLLISSENISRQILFLCLIGLMFLALVLSKSRMGILSAVVSLIFFYSVYSKITLNVLQRTWMIYLVIIVFIFFGLMIGLYPVIERYLLIEKDLPSRTLVWKDMMGIVKDFPVFGTGLGTFRYVFPLYKKSIQQPIVYLHAHNDYLQLLVETGILGFLSIMSALFMFLYTSFKDLIGLHLKKDYFRFFLLLGALTGLVSLLIHSLTDFNLHIPSNAIYFAFLIGLSKAIGSKNESNLKI